MRVAIKIIMYIRRLEQRLNDRERERDTSANEVLAVYKVLNQNMVDQIRHVQKLNNIFIALTLVLAFVVIIIIAVTV